MHFLGASIKQPQSEWKVHYEAIYFNTWFVIWGIVWYTFIVSLLHRLYCAPSSLQTREGRSAIRSVLETNSLCVKPQMSLYERDTNTLLQNPHHPSTYSDMLIRFPQTESKQIRSCSLDTCVLMHENRTGFLAFVFLLMKRVFNEFMNFRYFLLVLLWL